MGVVASIARNVAVMYSGVIVERGTVEDIFYRHEHPYTRGLLASVPRQGQRKDRELDSIEGTPPDLVNPPKGCPFADRCPYAMKVCHEQFPEETALSEIHSVLHRPVLYRGRPAHRRPAEGSCPLPGPVFRRYQITLNHS